MYSLVNGRNPRTKTQMYNPMHHQLGNYCTEALKKTEMKLDYENEVFLNNLHLIPDPLLKNLADTLVTSEKPERVVKNSLEAPIMAEPQEDRSESTLAGITNFFYGVFNMLSGAVFRTRSQVDYYDCFEEARQGSQAWRGANDGQDKNGKVLNALGSDGSIPNDVQDMNNCKAISTCEEKINQVKYLLPNKPSNTVWSRKRPKKVFVEPGAIEENFQDAISPEDYVALSNELYIECYSPPQHQNPELCQTEAPETKLVVPPVVETTEIVTEMTENKPVTESSDSKPVKDTLNLVCDNDKDSSDDKHQLVSTCEDKLSKLKALLKEKRTKHTTIIPLSEPITEQPRPAKTIPIGKHYKNPCRMLDKRRKMKLKQSIQDEVVFANDVDLESPVSSVTSTNNSSSETSVGDYFDELKGRFRSASTTESEDSFQIVFNDSPKARRASDCESEDSFIVFEDDCYTSNDVFGESDSESDVSDSGCSTMTCKLSHSLSRTVSNLTDDTLYESSDEVDCAKVEPAETRGLLVDAARKNLKKDQPSKHVRFSSEPPTVKVMRVWTFAARQARAGHWERYALDRERFKRRIADVDMAVSWVLKPQHRSRVMFQRFMPIWNKQKREELAEKKEKEAEEKRVREAERERIEEEKRVEEDDKRVKEENLFLLFESLRKNAKKNGKVKKTQDRNKVKSDVANVKNSIQCNDVKLGSSTVNYNDAKLESTENSEEKMSNENVANVIKGNDVKLGSTINDKNTKLDSIETNSDDIFNEKVSNEVIINDGKLGSTVNGNNNAKLESTENSVEKMSNENVANDKNGNDAKLKSTETNNKSKTQTNRPISEKDIT